MHMMLKLGVVRQIRLLLLSKVGDLRTGLTITQMEITATMTVTLVHVLVGEMSSPLVMETIAPTAYTHRRPTGTTKREATPVLQPLPLSIAAVHQKML